jgi:hypothetical protein
VALLCHGLLEDAAMDLTAWLSGRYVVGCGGFFVVLPPAYLALYPCSLLWYSNGALQCNVDVDDGSVLAWWQGLRWCCSCLNGVHSLVGVFDI